MSGVLHVVGGGLAGLACAVTAARSGAQVVLHEAAPHLGGRARSFHDPVLDAELDNGTHLLLGANTAVLDFLHTIGAAPMVEPHPTEIPFQDGADAWTVSPRRLSTGPLETLRALGLPWTGRHATVLERLGDSPSFRRMWEPLCLAALNTAPSEASARVFSRLLRAVLTGGAKAMRPHVFPHGLSAAFARPAQAVLSAHGARIHLGRRLTGVGERVLRFAHGEEKLAAHDRAVLALPPWVLSGLLPGIPTLPTRAIVNAHFRLPEPPVLPGNQPFLGLVGGCAQWLSLRGHILSVTVSDADALAALPAPDIAARLWRDCARALELPSEAPPCRVVKERRATLAHTSWVESRRPGPVTSVPWLFLAGDWLASPWPCTMESAVASGLTAARMAIKHLHCS